MYLILKRLPHGVWQIHELCSTEKEARETARGIDPKMWEVRIVKAEAV
jgi:hypothetical protein